MHISLYSVLYSCHILMKVEFFLTDFRKIFRYTISSKILLLGAELFHTEGQTDLHDEVNRNPFQFCEHT